MKAIMKIWRVGSLSPRLHPTSQEGSSGGASLEQRRAEQETSAKQNQAPRGSSASKVQLSDRSKVVAGEGTYREGKGREAKALLVAEAISAMAAHNDVSLIPVSTEVHVIDTAADADTINAWTSEVDELVSERRYQAARLLHSDLACEMDVMNAFLPLATYPAAIRSTASFDIPLPIVRADRQLNLDKQLGYEARLAQSEGLLNKLKRKMGLFKDQTTYSTPSAA